MALRAVAGPRNPTSIGTVAPAGPQPGQMWWNLDDVKLYVWDGAEWVVTVNTPEVTGGAAGGELPEAPADGRVYGRNGQLTSWQPVLTSAQSDARYLQLSGGQMSGGINYGNALASSPTDLSHHLSLYGGNWGGLSASSNQINIVSGGETHFYNLGSDTLGVTQTGIYSAVPYRATYTNSWGNGNYWVGSIALDGAHNQVGLAAYQYVTGGTATQHGAVWGYAYATANVGGTSGTPAGELWGGISSSQLEPGATNWTACIGHEVDFGVQSGASAHLAQGLKVVLGPHVQAVSVNDYMIGMALLQNNNAQIGNGIAFGSSDGYWPIASSGTLIGTVATDPGMAGPLAYTAAYGVDLSHVTFSGGAFRSTGFLIGPAGHATTAGVGCGTSYAADNTDLSKHLDLYGGQAGICLTSDTNLNYNNTGAHAFYVGATLAGYIVAGGLNGCAIGISSAANARFNSVGFQGTAPIAKPTVTGSKGANAALASLMTALASYGLVTDSTT